MQQRNLTPKRSRLHQLALVEHTYSKSTKEEIVIRKQVNNKSLGLGEKRILLCMVLLDSIEISGKNQIW